MKTIYKYPFEVKDRVVLQMPWDAPILTVQTQWMAESGERPCLWAIVDPHQAKISKATRTFYLIGTGHPIDDEEMKLLTYRGTFQLHGGTLVFHLFEHRAPETR